MKKFFSLILLSLLVLPVSARKPKSGEPSEKQYVVILSMDAFRWDLASRSHTPTLDSLARVGTYAQTYPVYPSNTFPSHYSMATGLHPDHHGVVNNSFYDKEAGKLLSVFDAEDVLLPGFWGGEPIWNTAERQNRTANIFMWPGSEVPVNGRQATVWTRYTSTPTFYERADWVVDAMTQSEDKIPDLVMWYFEEPDAVMHKYGPESEEAVAQAEHIDSVLCYFFREIRKSPVFDRINFIVTADHGMEEVSPKRYINLKPLLDTTQIVRAITGNPFGLEVRDEYVDTALRILKNTGHIDAWQRDKMPKRFHYGTYAKRQSNIIAIPENGWTLGYTSSRPPKIRKGSHGFDNRSRAMHMVFYASGPAFRTNYRQASFQNQNIYLILCHLLDIEPAQNDCNWREVKRMFTAD